VLPVNVVEKPREQCEDGVKDKQSVKGVKKVLRQEGRRGGNNGERQEGMMERDKLLDLSRILLRS